MPKDILIVDDETSIVAPSTPSAALTFVFSHLLFW